MMTKKRAFTLIELLTVIAITALLMTIIVVPVFQSFNFTRSAQAFAEAQARARILADRISREIASSTGTRSSSLQVATILNGKVANVPQHSLIIQLPIQPPEVGTIDVVLPYVKMDLLKAAQADLHGGSAAGGYTNPLNGFVDPTLHSARGQIILPVGTGTTIVRYFVGLRDPSNPYNNPYDGILMNFGGGRDNLFVLYRAEVQPYVWRNGAFRPNLDFFQADPTDTQIRGLDDPRFFIPDGLGYDGTIDPNKNTRVNNWKTVSVMQTELSRFDMIQPVYNKFTRTALYHGDAPVVLPLIQFRPSHVGNDPAQGQVAVREGEEANNSAAFAPDIFKTQYGMWSNQIVRTWPQTWDPNAVPNTVSQYFVGRNDPSNGTAGAPPGFSIYYYDPSGSISDVASGIEVFDLYTYDLVTSSGGRYPFSQAITAANNRSGWMTNPAITNLFVPYDLNSAKGKVITSFNISEVGNPNTSPSLTNPQNLPTVATNPSNTGPFAAGQDPNVVGGNFYDPAFASVNEIFNWVWANASNLQPQIDRFIDLRTTPTADGTPSPLNPVNGFAKCRIVPGSEIVYGPDQLDPTDNIPGTNPLQRATVRYTRTTQTPGPNQYQMNYVDQPEPTNASNQIDYTLLGLTAAEVNGFNPNVYDAHNFCSAIIQPRYKKGYIKFNSDPTAPLPIGQIQVSYKFQFNGTQTGTAIVGAKSDVFAVDYDTRQLMSVLLTIRNYPQTTNTPNPQTVTLKATAAVKNYIR
ncbi:MAG: type II secretion system protein [Fimbriimonas sp.]|nr:type II secretion system protein [Fimbriimonas sp.]